MRLYLLPIVVLAVSSCSQEQQVVAPKAARSTMAPSPTVSANADAVPAAFLGVWDFMEGNCNPASDLRIEIKSRSIEFYESHGDITKVTVESPEAVVLDLAMEGEGETWTMRQRYTLSNGGKTLTPTNLDDGNFKPMPLMRCES